MFEQKNKDPTAYHRQEHLNDLKKLLATKEGRKVLWELLDWCNLIGSSFRQNPIDMAYLEGQRSIGQKLFRNIEAADDNGYLKLLEEHKKTLAEEAAIKEVAEND